jgi:hypothetical protein
LSRIPNFLRFENEDIIASLEVPITVYPFLNKRSARYDPSCPDMPIIRHLFSAMSILQMVQAKNIKIIVSISAFGPGFELSEKCSKSSGET